MHDRLFRGASDALATWDTALHSGDFGTATKVASRVVDACARILRRPRRPTRPPTRDAALIVGVLFRGCEDYAALDEKTRAANWLGLHPIVESAWRLVWDVQDRIGFAASRLAHPVIAATVERVGRIRDAVLAAHGPGIYASAELIECDLECSVCGHDPRGCDHRPGRLYDGVVCSVHPQQVQIGAVAFVTNPRDPRCRAWPWNYRREERTATTVVAVAFEYDDFVRERGHRLAAAASSSVLATAAREGRAPGVEAASR